MNDEPYSKNNSGCSVYFLHEPNKAVTKFEIVAISGEKKKHIFFRTWFYKSTYSLIFKKIRLSTEKNISIFNTPLQSHPLRLSRGVKKKKKRCRDPEYGVCVLYSLGLGSICCCYTLTSAMVSRRVSVGAHIYFVRGVRNRRRTKAQRPPAHIYKLFYYSFFKN
jgi:hypothetical protein